MTTEQVIALLKVKILEIENSKKDNDKNQQITIVHLPADVFLLMANLFVGIDD